MASRRGSLEKLDLKLKTLMRRIPEGEELYKILEILISSQPDPSSPFGSPMPHLLFASERASTITVAAVLDHGLQKALPPIFGKMLNHQE